MRPEQHVVQGWFCSITQSNVWEGLSSTPGRTRLLPLPGENRRHVRPYVSTKYRSPSPFRVVPSPASGSFLTHVSDSVPPKIPEGTFWEVQHSFTMWLSPLHHCSHKDPRHLGLWGLPVLSPNPRRQLSASCPCTAARNLGQAGGSGTAGLSSFVSIFSRVAAQYPSLSDVLKIAISYVFSGFVVLPEGRGKWSLILHLGQKSKPLCELRTGLQMGLQRWINENRQSSTLVSVQLWAWLLPPLGS